MQLLQDEYDARRKRRQPESNFLQPYVAARLDSLPEVFTLGDGHDYHGFRNKALPGQQQYRCFVLAELTERESVRVSILEPRGCASWPNVSIFLTARKNKIRTATSVGRKQDKKTNKDKNVKCEIVFHDVQFYAKC